jgi:hypothetical protein
MGGFVSAWFGSRAHAPSAALAEEERPETPGSREAWGLNKSPEVSKDACQVAGPLKRPTIEASVRVHREGLHEEDGR